MVGRATLRIVLSREMTRRATDRTRRVHQRRSKAVCADICSSPLITIRAGCVSLVKHMSRIYATSSFRIYGAVLLAGLALAPSAAAAPWRPHVRDAARYAEHRGGEVSFAIRGARSLRGMGV